MAAARRHKRPIPLYIGVWFLLTAACGLADFPALTGRVVDEAGLFTPDQAAELETILAEYETATTDQFVVVTVDRTGDLDIKSYSVKLFNTWRLGRADQNNGALLSIAVKDRQARITTGTGLALRLTDEECDGIFESQIVPAFRAGQYYEGTRNALLCMMELASDYHPPGLAAEEPVTVEDADVQETQEPVHGSGVALVFLGAIILVVFAAPIALVVMIWLACSASSTYSSHGSHNGYRSLGGGWGGRSSGSSSSSSSGGGYSGGGGRSSGGGVGGGW